MAIDPTGLRPRSRRSFGRTANVPYCTTIGTLRDYTPDLTMSVVYRGQSGAGNWVRFEVIARTKFSARVKINRMSLVVGGEVRYQRRGRTGFRHQVQTFFRPEPGKPNPHYVHTTLTLKHGTILDFAAAGALNDALISAGPTETCRVNYRL